LISSLFKYSIIPLKK